MLTMPLDELMSEGVVVRSYGDGASAEAVFHDAPEFQEEGWTLLEGFTSQHGYNGPAMHPSEYIGGGLERYILETPGLYCVLYSEDAWYVASLRRTGDIEAVPGPLLAT